MLDYIVVQTVKIHFFDKNKIGCVFVVCLWHIVDIHPAVKIA